MKTIFEGLVWIMEKPGHWNREDDNGCVARRGSCWWYYPSNPQTTTKGPFKTLGDAILVVARNRSRWD